MSLLRDICLAGAVAASILVALYFSDVWAEKKATKDANAPAVVSNTSIDFPFKKELRLRGYYTVQDDTVTIHKIEKAGALLSKKYPITPAVKCSQVDTDKDVADFLSLLADACKRVKQLRNWNLDLS